MTIGGAVVLSGAFHRLAPGSGVHNGSEAGIFESNVPGGSSPIDDLDRLSSDTLTMQAPKFICLLDGPLLPRSQPKEVMETRVVFVLANPSLGSVIPTILRWTRRSRIAQRCGWVGYKI